MASKRVHIVLCLFLAALIGTACNARIITGSGDMITETRQVKDFDKISVSGSGEVIVTQGESESLSIETDDNVMKHIEAEVEGGTLKLGIKNGINLISTTRLVFYVGVDDLTGLSISGSGDVESDRIETGRLEVKISGSGDVKIASLTADAVKAEISGIGEIDLDGDVAAQDVDVSGSGQYLAGDLCSGSVKVSVSGSGGATVCATETLDASVSGTGSVNYYGRPSLTTSESGTGKINSLGEK
jgi:hypothetical protein